jgi:hypothetical protein
MTLARSSANFLFPALALKRIRVIFPIQERCRKYVRKVRPAEAGTAVTVRLHDPLLAAIDRYRTTIGEEITRAEALRQLAGIALGDMKPKKKK